jgi:thiamine-phosphate pyrophosphorylase
VVTVLDLSQRSLYLCVGVRRDMATFLPAVLRGGVDVVQLREKSLPDEVRIEQARLMIPICHDYGVPFVMNDSAELALAVGADGVHVGQDDASVEHCREVLGDEAIVGLSTHADREFDAGLLEPVTYLSAGPIVETPTKVGRAGTGVDYAARAQARSSVPVFVTGGVTNQNVRGLVARGLRHFVVVRYLTESHEPEKSAHVLRQALDSALGDYGTKEGTN